MPGRSRVRARALPGGEDGGGGARLPVGVVVAEDGEGLRAELPPGEDEADCDHVLRVGAEAVEGTPVKGQEGVKQLVIGRCRCSPMLAFADGDGDADADVSHHFPFSTSASIFYDKIIQCSKT